MADDDDGGQQLYWDDDSKRYYKYDAEKDDYFTDDETRAADEAAAQEAAEEAGKSSTDTPPNETAKESPRSPPASPSVAPSSSSSLTSVDRTGSSRDVKSSSPVVASAAGASEAGSPNSGDTSKETLPPTRQGSKTDPTPATTTTTTTPAVKEAVPETRNADDAKTSQEIPPHTATENSGTSSNAAPSASASVIEIPSRTSGPSAPDSPVHIGQALGPPGRQSTSGGAKRNGDLGVASDLLPRASSRFGGGSSLLGDGKPDGDFSLSSRRGSGMSSGLAEAAVAFHELETKKKEVQELQEKLAKTERKVEELSVRLIQAERGMTDDERVANLTRERDELLIQVKRLEDDLAGFEECLEAAAVEKETALVQAEKNKELSSDLKLQYDNLLIDKDLEIATLREELAQKQVELQTSQQLRPEIAQLRERILHYDKTFVQLKQLLLKVSSEKNAIEEENQALMEYRSKAEERIAELEGGAAEDAQLLQTYESQHGAQRDLIETQERQLDILVRQLQESNAAKVTYQQAFDRLSKVFKEKEAKNRAAMEQLNVENKQLRSKNEHLQSLTAPRWQRVYTLKQQSKTPLKKLAVKSTPPMKSGSSAFSSGGGGGTRSASSSSSDSAEGKTAQESSSAEGDEEVSQAHGEGVDSSSGRLIERGQEGSHEKIIDEGVGVQEGILGGTQGEEMLEALQIQMATLQAHAIQRQIQISCRDEKLRLLRLALPDDCVAKIVKTSEGVVAMHAAVWQCFLYLQHVHGLYVQPLLADATSNPKTTTKEQGFILWLFNSIRSVAFLARALSLFLYYLRSSSSSTSTSSILPLLESPDGAAYTIAMSALRHTSKIVSSATACTLSSSFPLEPFDDAVHALSLLLPSSLAQAITGVPPPSSQQPGPSSSSSSSSWKRETDSKGSKVGLEKAGSKQARDSDRSTSPSKAGAPGRKSTQGGEQSQKSPSSTSLPTTGQEEKEDAKGRESIDTLMSLAPCVVSILHVMRAIGLLAVAGSCAFEVDKSGEKGAAVAGVIAAQDARAKWMEFMTSCSKALHALPSWLPPVVEGQEGILEKKSDKSDGGEKNEKGKGGFFLLRRDHSSRGGSGDASQKGGAGRNLSTPTRSTTTFGAWIGRKVKIEKERRPEEENDAANEEEDEEGRDDDNSSNSTSKEKKENKKKGQQETSGFPSFEETFLATRRLLTQLVEAPELKDSKFIPDRGFEILNTFVCAFDTDKRTIASVTVSPVVAGWCSVWDTIPSSIHSWLKEEEKMDKKVEQLIEEEKKLQAQIEEQRETIAEKERLASKWEHLYSSARPKAEKYDRLEEELQAVLKEKSNCVHMLDAARRKVDQQNHEAHQLRHDKREIGVRLQELTKRLEALKKVSLSHAGGGGDVEQIQMLRQIIRKQEAELLEVRLAGALKDAIPSKHEQEAVDVLRELGRGSTADSLTSAGSFSRAPSFMQDLRRDGTEGGPLAWQRSLPRQQSSAGRMPTGVVHSSSLQQRVLMHQQTLKMQIEEAEADAQDISGPEAGLQMLEEYRRLQNAVLLHSFQVPIWNPSVAPEENRAKLRRYRNEHDALQLQMLSLTKKIDRFFSRVAEGSRGGFGEHASLSTSRYIRQFTMLADVASPASSLQSSSPCLDQTSSSSTATRGVGGDSTGTIQPSASVKDETTGKEGETLSVKTEHLQPHPVTDLAVRDGFNTPAGIALRTPVMRLTVAGKPAWMQGGSGGKAAYTAGGGATQLGEANGKTGESSGDGRGKHERMVEKGENAGKGIAASGRCPEIVQKRLIVTEAQLAALYKKIAGL